MKISILGSSRAARALVLGFTTATPSSAAFLATSSLALVAALSGCASTSGNENHVTVLKRTEAPTAEVGGIPPDKQAEIQLLLQQRDSATTKCYADVLNDKHDRAFKGHVAVLLSVEPNGTASDVKIVSSSLNSQEVTDCLVEKLKSFEYPQLDHAGTMQYVYHFEPAY